MPRKFDHRVMYIELPLVVAFCWTSICLLNWIYKGSLRLFSDVWGENADLFERLVEIHSNPPLLYYGFKVPCERDYRLSTCGNIYLFPWRRHWLRTRNKAIEIDLKGIFGTFDWYANTRSLSIQELGKAHASRNQGRLNWNEAVLIWLLWNFAKSNKSCAQPCPTVLVLYIHMHSSSLAEKYKVHVAVCTSWLN